jgi:hypothetical protein
MRFALLLPLIALSACAIPTSRSNLVIITESAAVVEGCKNLGKVDGGIALNQVLLRDQSLDSARARLKIATADLGGTHVVSTVADAKWKGPDTTGTAYECGRR